MNPVYRTPLIVLASLCAPLPAMAQSSDTPPTTPDGLVAQAYGTTSGEIRWNRSSDDRGVVGYEVRRDGDVLGTFDALSYVDRTFGPDTAYRFEVTAIDTAGQRSDTANVTLDTTNAAGARRPAAPVVGSVNVYSGTAAEIAWSRPDTPGLTYTVRRDGTLVYEGDATSFFDDGLSPATSYAYDVQAIDSQGRSSEVSSVSLITSAGPGGDPQVDSSRAPEPPRGLSATRYSASAGELFWEREPVSGLTYAVLRDGITPLGTTTGTSFFDDSLPGPGDYRYDVFAIGANGNESNPASTVLRALGGMSAPNGPDAAVIAPDTYVDVLAYAFEIYAGKRFGGEILALPGYPAPDLGDDRPLSEDDGPTSVTIACDNGGTLAYTESLFGDRQVGTTRDYAFDGCQGGTATYDGAFVSEDFGNVQVRSSGLEVVDGARTTRFSGGLSYMNMSNRDGGPTRGYGMGEVDYSVEGESPVALTDSSFSYSYVLGGFDFGIDGGYRVASPFTAGRELVVSTPEPLDFDLAADPAFQADETRPESVRFATGTLRVEDPNGDSLTLIADNGDPLTANVEVVSGDVTETFVQPWSTWAEALDFDFDLR